MEDSAEDIATLQIPSPWRSQLEDPSTLHLFMSYYEAAVPPLSNAALECLVRCASVRRSLFSSEDVRIAFLSAIVNITLSILRTQHGLQHAENYHEFCRLLGRVRNNYQLSEIMAAENYSTWIEHVASFTIKSLQVCPRDYSCDRSWSEASTRLLRNDFVTCQLFPAAVVLLSVCFMCASSSRAKASNVSRYGLDPMARV